jgi:hypothetical protein
MTTLATIRTRVKFQLGGRSNIDTRIDDNINAAIYQLIMEMKPQEMQTEVILKPNTSTATAEYAFNDSTATVWATGQDTATTDVLAILMVRDDTDDVEITRGGLVDYNRARQDTTTASNTGKPRRWTRRANTLILYDKLPDTSARTLTVTYLKRPTELSADADTFPLNREWEKPAEYLTTAICWQDLNRPDLSGAGMQAYRDFLVNMDKPESLEDETPEAQLVPMNNLNF